MGSNGASQTYFLQKAPTACYSFTLGNLLPTLSTPVSHFQLPETDFLPNPAFFSVLPHCPPPRPWYLLSLPNPLLQSSARPSACPLHLLMTLSPAHTRALSGPILLVFSLSTPAKPGPACTEFSHTHILPSAWNIPQLPIFRCQVKCLGLPGAFPAGLTEGCFITGGGRCSLRYIGGGHKYLYLERMSLIQLHFIVKAQN